MRILMIGDIFGRPGRKAVRENLSSIKQELKLDMIIANGENASGGNGITPATANELFDYGIDVLTMGNHVWDKKEILGHIQKEPRIIRPANYPPGTPGRGYGIFNINGVNVGVINLSGLVYLLNLDCPFRTVEQILNEINDLTNIIIVDFHAEATSEKIALGWYLDGKVTAVAGTHTHVQTADERILPGGTAYITDLGMTGPLNSIIGVKIDIALKKFITQMPVRFESADGPFQFNAVVIEVDEDTGSAVSINRVFNIEY
ncbi:TIGR00282 family metallophosphoesterase [Phosphitispora fastidiosa]|uniref:TIGR00282 family metallophosphoesterase n=1 Tax=Phosphitispora fastidiosa TaxID=2837202 RepID=UPI001E40FBB0|nr:TIGR00282 family metallophosphoesterase [Phosphitispora fastidiosa]MBU7005247.1 metallophosphoesterase (TIGR00282 family) [Phosphitispora fastidiosa]